MHDRELWSLFRGMCLVAAPLRKWHAEASKATRSCEECKQLAIRTSSGAGYILVRETVAMLMDASWLEDLGCFVHKPPPPELVCA